MRAQELTSGSNRTCEATGRGRVVLVRLRGVSMIGGLLIDVFVVVNAFETGRLSRAEHSYIVKKSSGNCRGGRWKATPWAGTSFAYFVAMILSGATRCSTQRSRAESTSSAGSEGSGPFNSLSKGIRTRSAAAVSHSRNHEKTIKFPGFFRATH